MDHTLVELLPELCPQYFRCVVGQYFSDHAQNSPNHYDQCPLFDHFCDFVLVISLESIYGLAYVQRRCKLGDTSKCPKRYLGDDNAPMVADHFTQELVCIFLRLVVRKAAVCRRFYAVEAVRKRTHFFLLRRDSDLFLKALCPHKRWVFLFFLNFFR